MWSISSSTNFECLSITHSWILTMESDHIDDTTLQLTSWNRVDLLKVHNAVKSLLDCMRRVTQPAGGTSEVTCSKSPVFFCSY